jgi:Domain of unknown function (DUF4331)
MSSHREAPEISKDPVADSTDLYAFVSPDRPGTVTIIANYIPLEAPDGGPNFYEFGHDVLYAINIDNDGDARPAVTPVDLGEGGLVTPGDRDDQGRIARSVEFDHVRLFGATGWGDGRRRTTQSASIAPKRSASASQ